jgi:C1A family cysteine protease
LILALAVSAIFAIKINPHSASQEFYDFIAKYNKHYSPEEFQQRSAIFQSNLQIIKLQNRKAHAAGKDTQFGVNKFSDLDPKEFASLYFGYKETRPHVDKVESYDASADPLPVSFDWRTKGAVSPVKNQEQCGSCWAFSATEGVESAWFLAKKQLLILSPQQIVSCDANDDGCDGGDLPTAFGYIQQNGLEPDAVYPYTSGNGDDGSCLFDSTKVVAKISGFKYATTTGNETAMQAAMIPNGPLSICVDASTWQNYQGGVITHGCGDSLDHCVQIVGWASTAKNDPYWIVRNSWGTDWGLNGYLWVERGHDECGISDEATYVTI